MIRRFLSYVEIMTKITSVFAFLMSLAWLFYLRQPIDWKLTGIFFVSMFLFDLVTTAINNYIDTKTNAQKLQFKRRGALAVIIVLLAVSTGFGLYLAYLTDWVVLVLGGICFVCGVFYTWGPVPISRQPLGELFSGLFYGLLIPFIMFYINMPQGTYLTLDVVSWTISLTIHIRPFLPVILLTAAPVCATANIMLANNICDLDRDIAVKRHTLPYYLGDRALYLFAGLYYLIYAAAILLVAAGILPPVYLLFLATLLLVQKNINTFRKKQEKETTFICSIQNYIIIMGTQTLLLIICRWFS